MTNEQITFEELCMLLGQREVIAYQLRSRIKVLADENQQLKSQLATVPDSPGEETK